MINLLKMPSEGKLAWFARIAQRDYCPWANRYVYWLKEPVGWFVFATAVSALVGCFLSPLGWTIAAGLVAILMLGLGFPWLVTRTTRCELRPLLARLHERQNAEFELSVRNPLPIPIWGLMIEGFLTVPCDRFQETKKELPPGLGLARVPALSTAKFRWATQPEFRGCYPIRMPMLVCGFPFGIWTARREIKSVEPVTVWPLLIPIENELEFGGRKHSDVGNGHRPTDHGDFLGVRDFRRGDSLRSIHWVQSARNQKLVVCERGGPQQQLVELSISTWSSQGYQDEARENLAWRVRIAASLVDYLVSRHIPLRLFVDGVARALPHGEAARNKALDCLAKIPIDGSVKNARKESTREPSDSSQNALSRFTIVGSLLDGRPTPPEKIRIHFRSPSNHLRSRPFQQECLIDLDGDIARQFHHFLREVSRASYVA